MITLLLLYTLQHVGAITAQPVIVNTIAVVSSVETATAVQAVRDE